MAEASAPSTSTASSTAPGRSAVTRSTRPLLSRTMPASMIAAGCTRWNACSTWSSSCSRHPVPSPSSRSATAFPRTTRRARRPPSGCSNGTRTSCGTSASRWRWPPPTPGRSSRATGSPRTSTTCPRWSSPRRRSRRCSWRRSRRRSRGRPARPNRPCASSRPGWIPARWPACRRGPWRRGRPESATSTRTPWCGGPATGTWWGWTGTAARSARSGCRGSGRTRRRPDRDRPRRRGSTPGSTWPPGGGVLPTIPWRPGWRSRRTSRGGRRPRRPGRFGPWTTGGWRWPFPPTGVIGSCRGSCRSARTRCCWPPRTSAGRPSAAWRRSVRPGRVSERLRRLLAVVPYVVQHPGVRLEDLSRLFGVAEHELAADLELLFMSGLPPYGPGDLIEVQVEDGRVWISMADYFARPLRLTRSEALWLYLQGTALLGAPGLQEAGALESALHKLEEVLGPDTLGGLAGRVEAADAGPVAGHLEAVRDAAERHERLEIEYYAASTDETSVRRIDPEHVFSAIGQWYVVAFDHRSEQERMFRVDRIRKATPTGETFGPRGLPGAGRPLYSRSEEDVPVRLRLAPDARWVAEYYETDAAEDLPEGGVEAVLPTKRLAWVARLVLRLGGSVEVVEPPELQEEVRRVAGEALERYGALTGRAPE